MKPKIHYDYDEGVWYVEFLGQRSWKRSRQWLPMLHVALHLAETHMWDSVEGL